jgi:hypothetical protein
MSDDLGEVLQNQQDTNVNLSGALAEAPTYLVLNALPMKGKITTIVSRRRYVNDSFVLGHATLGKLGQGVVLSSMNSAALWTIGGPSSAVETTNTTNNSAAQTAKLGFRFVVGATAVTLTKITKDASCTATTAYLMASDGTTQLATAAFSGNDATFSYSLSSSTTYYVMASSAGGSYQQRWKTGGSGFPIAGTYVTYNAGWGGGSPDPTYGYNIASITVVPASSAPTNDTTNYKTGGSSVNVAWTSGGANYLQWNSTTFGNISTYTGAASGVPSKGTVGLWLYQPSASSVSSLVLKIGSDASNYLSVNATYGTRTLADTGWVYITFVLNTGSATGTPNWTTTAYYKLDFTAVGSAGNVSYDYTTINQANTVGLNGLGDRRDAWVTLSTNTY